MKRLAALVGSLGLFWFALIHHATAGQQLYAEPVTANGTAFQRLYRLSWHDYGNGEQVPLSNLPSYTAAEQVTMTLFYFNDLHGKVVIPDTRRGNTAVFAQMMKRVNDARANANHPVLFVSAGDDHTGEVYDELLGTSVDTFQKSLPYHVYSHGGLDAAVIGNHELDRGIAILAKKIQKNARFPLLSANIIQSDVLTYPWLAPALVGDIDGARIGLIGLTSYQDSKKTHVDDPGFKIIPPLPALQDVVLQLEPHVDFIVVLSHLGYQQSGVLGEREVAELLSKRNIPSIVVGGHSHTLLHEHGLEQEHVIGGVPVLQAGSWGSHIGEVTFSWSPAARTEAVSMVVHDSKVHPILPQVHEGEWVDEAFQQQVIQPVLKQFESLLSEKIGVVGNSPELTTATTMQTRYTGESAMANLLTDAVFSRQHAFSQQPIDAVAFNASGILGGFSPGEPLLFKDLFRVMPYADIIQVVAVTPSQLKQLLSSNAQRIIREEERQNYQLDGFINRGFLHFSASLRYTIILGSEAAEAFASGIYIHGKPLESYPEDAMFRLAIGDYLMKGTQGWSGGAIEGGLSAHISGFDLTVLPIADTGYVMRNEMVQALREQTLIMAGLDGRLLLQTLESVGTR